MKKLFVVVLTGGPCGGKSSSLRSVRNTLRGRGYNVMTMPEVPTILMSNGANFPGIDGPRKKLLQYEVNLINLQITMEDSFKSFLELDGLDNTALGVLICDRAAPDTAAYLPVDLWETLLAKMNCNHLNLLNRYDIVCHLVTAAEGAEEFYTTENNTVRTETAEEARALDKRTLACWNGHTCHKVFPNTEGQDFKGKLDDITRHIVHELELRI